MNKPRNQLARLPKTTSALRRRVVFAPAQSAHPDSQYVITRTALGEFALHWTAEWLAGIFCVTDFPAEWAAFTLASIHGSWHEAVWPAVAPFSGAAGDPSRQCTIRECDSPQLPLPFREVRALPP